MSVTRSSRVEIKRTARRTLAPETKVKKEETETGLEVPKTRKRKAVKKEAIPIEVPKRVYKREPNVDQETLRTQPKVKKENSTVKELKTLKQNTKKAKVEKITPKKEHKVKKEKKVIKLPIEASMYMDEAMRGRVLRSLKQRMFVLSREVVPTDDSCEKFEVLGSVGNKYTVTIAKKIGCSCRDYIMRRTHCKHILMILLKVYKLEMNNPLFHSLSTSCEQRINAKNSGNIVDPDILVPAHIREQILKVTHLNHPDIAPKEEIARRPLDTSDCPICFEEFEEGKIDHIDFCKVCGNNIHDECFSMWKQSKGRDVTCVYCRSKWVIHSKGGPSKRSVKEYDDEHLNNGVPNFAKELGISTKRDTSTYKNYRGYPDYEF